MFKRQLFASIFVLSAFCNQSKAATIINNAKVWHDYQQMLTTNFGATSSMTIKDGSCLISIHFDSAKFITTGVTMLKAHAAKAIKQGAATQNSIKTDLAELQTFPFLVAVSAAAYTIPPGLLLTVFSENKDIDECHIDNFYSDPDADIITDDTINGDNEVVSYDYNRGQYNQANWQAIIDGDNDSFTGFFAALSPNFPHWVMTEVLAEQKQLQSQ
jgi:hypothetical protein